MTSTDSEDDEGIEVSYTYTTLNDLLFEKISHADTGVEQADGIVDYLGLGFIGEYVLGVSETGNGDRGQSYSYASASYGDWVYIATMYGGLGVSAILTRGITSTGADTTLAEALMDFMYNGNLYTGEDDGYSAGGMLVKVNVKTGETVILMSQYTNGIIPTFRSAVEFNGKLYFVGMVMDTNNEELTAAEIVTAIAYQNGFPCIYEIDPETDEITCVYDCVDVEGFRELVADSVFTSTRAIGTFGDTLIAGALDEDNGVYLVASNDPSAGQDSFTVIATMEDFDNLPAYHRSDVNGGGGIYQVCEYNGKLYVVICTGTSDSYDEETGCMDTFAIYVGTCSGDATDPDAWTWEPFVGDTSNGATYTFGIDPERVAAGACTLQVYGDYLYIGEYNDLNSGLQNIVLYTNLVTMATELEQSIRLYRMDADGNIELVVGETSELFPTSLTGLDSGYESHANQYTWQTVVYEGTMYVSTADSTTLLEPLAQLTNGDLLEMDAEEWQSQINYLRVLVELMFDSLTEDDDTTEEATVEEVESADEATVAATALEAEDDEAEAATDESAEAEDDATADDETTDDLTTEELVEAAIESADERKAETMVENTDVAADEVATVELTEEQVESLVTSIEEGEVEVGAIAEEADDEEAAEALLSELSYLNDMLNSLDDLVDTTEIESFLDVYEALLELFADELYDQLPESLQSLYELLLDVATEANLKALVSMLSLLSDSERGFDLYAVDQDDDGNVTVTDVTLDGFGDVYNHGLRIFELTTDYLLVGTANPFYGTQLWRLANTEDVYYTIEVEVEGEGTAYASATEATAGTTIYLTAEAADGYHFVGWEVVRGLVTVEDDAFEMGGVDVVVRAVFEADDAADDDADGTDDGTTDDGTTDGTDDSTTDDGTTDDGATDGTDDTGSAGTTDATDTDDTGTTSQASSTTTTASTSSDLPASGDVTNTTLVVGLAVVGVLLVGTALGLRMYVFRRRS